MSGYSFNLDPSPDAIKHHVYLGGGIRDWDRETLREISGVVGLRGSI